MNPFVTLENGLRVNLNHIRTYQPALTGTTPSIEGTYHNGDTFYWTFDSEARRDASVTQLDMRSNSL